MECSPNKIRVWHVVGVDVVPVGQEHEGYAAGVGGDVVAIESGIAGEESRVVKEEGSLTAPHYRTAVVKGTVAGEGVVTLDVDSAWIRDSLITWIKESPCLRFQAIIRINDTRIIANE